MVQFTVICVWQCGSVVGPSWPSMCKRGVPEAERAAAAETSESSAASMTTDTDEGRQFENEALRWGQLTKPAT